MNPIDYATKKQAAIEKETRQRNKRGPKTAAGKARSRVNATRHGLAGRTVLLPTEDLSEFETFTAEFLASLDPRTPMERELARTISDGYWRLRRVRTTEDSLYAIGHDEPAGDFDAENETIHAVSSTEPPADRPYPPDEQAEIDACGRQGRTFRDNDRAFVNLSIYESRIHRTIEKATKQLDELQAERKAQAKARLLEALRLRDLNKSKGLPYDPQADEFVYSSEEIEREANRRDRLREAARIIPIDQKAA